MHSLPVLAITKRWNSAKICVLACQGLAIRNSFVLLLVRLRGRAAGVELVGDIMALEEEKRGGSNVTASELRVWSQVLRRLSVA